MSKRESKQCPRCKGCATIEVSETEQLVLDAMDWLMDHKKKVTVPHLYKRLGTLKSWGIKTRSAVAMTLSRLEDGGKVMQTKTMVAGFSYLWQRSSPKDDR